MAWEGKSIVLSNGYWLMNEILTSIFIFGLFLPPPPPYPFTNLPTPHPPPYPPPPTSVYIWAPECLEPAQKWYRFILAPRHQIPNHVDPTGQHNLCEFLVVVNIFRKYMALNCEWISFTGWWILNVPAIFCVGYLRPHRFMNGLIG